jgi:hypothetical protein
MRNLQLTPLKRVCKDLKFYKIAFCDIESMHTKSVKFRCGSIAYKDKRNFIRTKTFFNDKLYFDYIFANFKIIYFFNIRYDSNFLRNYIFDYSNYTEFEIASNSNILGFKYIIDNDGNSVIFKDLAPYCQTSLEKSSIEYETKTRKYPEIDYENKLIIDKWFKDSSDIEIQKHCENDCLILLEIAFKMRKNFFEDFSVDIFEKKLFSPPSLSIKILRTKYITEPLDNPNFLIKMEKGSKSKIICRKDIEDFERKVYKGGYCNVENNAYFTDIESYDIISSYPYAISKLKLPIGKAYKTNNLQNFLKYMKKNEGCCKIKLKFDIPLICGIRNGKLVKLKGVFTEYITTIELKMALKYGAKILKFYVGLCFTDYDKTYAFKRYELDMFKRKSESNGGKRSGFKLLCNSPYGKVSQNYIQESRISEYIRDINDFEQLRSGNDVIKAIRYQNKGGILIKKSLSEKPKGFMMLIWGCLIAAFSRCYLLEQSYRSKSIYEDTDSIKITKNNKKYLINLAKNSKFYGVKGLEYKLLGKWELENEITEFRALAPKTYAYSYLKDGKLKQIVKCKGVQKSERKDLYNQIIEGNSELKTKEYYKIMSPNESLIALKSDNVIKDNDGLFGGIRKMSKTLHPKPKKTVINDKII